MTTVHTYLLTRRQALTNGILVSMAFLLLCTAAVLVTALIYKNVRSSERPVSPTIRQEKARSASVVSPNDGVRDVLDAVDAYEFLKVMQGSRFLAEDDRERLLGNPYNITKSPKGVIYTHLYTGGAVQYQLSKYDSGVIGSVGLKKASEKSRQEIKSGDFDTGSRLLRILKHREYCLLMLKEHDANLTPRKEPNPPQTESPQTPTIETAVQKERIATRTVEPQPVEPTVSEPLTNQISLRHSEEEASDNYRTWTSADGKHTCQAEFAAFENSKAHLRKRDGQVVSLSIYSLCETDQNWIRKHLRQQKQQGQEDMPTTAHDDKGYVGVPRLGLWELAQ